MFKCAVQFNKSRCVLCMYVYVYVCMRMYACKVCICIEINLSGCVVRDTEKMSFQEFFEEKK